MQGQLEISSGLVILIESIEVHHILDNVEEECHVHFSRVIIRVIGVWVELLLAVLTELLHQERKSEHGIVAEVQVLK